MPHTPARPHTETLTRPDGASISFNMVEVVGGTFMMGLNEKEKDEKPPHEVELDTFWIGQYPVTQDLYQFVMGENPSYFKGKRRPVEQVSWEDTQIFFGKLANDYGIQYRLPTEAEWEYAARGGIYWKEGFEYAGGNDPDKAGWHIENSPNETMPVGLKAPNQLGIYDMSGNVWEWCEDWFGDYQKSTQNNPKGPENGDYRVLRGGNWDIGPVFMWVAYRVSINPFDRDSFIGFRLSRI